MKKNSSLPRLIYTLLLWQLMPYIALHLVWRSRKQPEYLEHVGERFGFYESAAEQPVIWLHTVSVGETRAVASLVKRLRAAYPDHRLLLTHTTPTGRAESERLYRDDVLRVYIPYDYPFAVKRFLDRFQPAVGILMETEIWPNLIHACHRKKIPLLLLNARLSEKSAARYARYPRLTRMALQELGGIAAQTAADAGRLEELGAQGVETMGNLKFDIEPPPEMLELGGRLRQQFGESRPVFLAASTRDGEEELLLDAIGSHGVAGLLTVIVPRHPQRFDEVAALLTRRNIEFVRRSENRPVPLEAAVVLGDSMGEMFAYYVACDVAFIGGSLLPFGGQNLIEACAVGKPVLVGEHTYNFRDATDDAVACGAAIRVSDAAELGDKLGAMLENREHLLEMGRTGLAYAKKNQGATDRAVRYIQNVLHGNR